MTLISNDLLDMTAKSTSTKEQKEKFESMKIKNAIFKRSYQKGDTENLLMLQEPKPQADLAEH